MVYKVNQNGVCLFFPSIYERFSILLDDDTEHSVNNTNDSNLSNFEEKDVPKLHKKSCFSLWRRQFSVLLPFIYDLLMYFFYIGKSFILGKSKALFFFYLFFIAEVFPKDFVQIPLCNASKNLEKNTTKWSIILYNVTLFLCAHQTFGNSNKKVSKINFFCFVLSI